MKYGVFVATPRGCQQALRLVQALQNNHGAAGEYQDSYESLQGEAEFFVHCKQAKVMEELAKALPLKWQSYQKLSDVFAQGMGNYDGLIFVMATGIVVRTLAPHLVSKLLDPAVLVMDDGGRNIISLLSGHIGGANRLTAYLARELEANPVITTATDVNNLLAPDVVAADLQCLPTPKRNLPLFNGSLLTGQRLVYWVDSQLKARKNYEAVLQRHQIAYRLVENLSEALVGIDSEKLYVVITSQAENLPSEENILYLQPRMLIAGVGCRRNTPKELIAQALAEACGSIGWSTGRISQLASTVVKADEAGLLAMAEELQVPIEFFENQQMAEMIEKYQLKESNFVKKTIGIGNICEAAALCCVPQGRIALSKHKYEKVTVALIWQK